MSKHILIIDDDPVVLSMAGDILTGAGYDVSTADCGVYSNHIIYGSHPPHLILLDVIMPHMDGVKKARLLKQRDKSAGIPIILMSTKPADELRSLAESAGVDDCLCKPFDAETLLNKVDDLLALKNV